LGRAGRPGRGKGRPLSGDPFNLARFIKPQDAAWPQVVAELTAGRKRSHWIWFIFPQIAGLGSSVRSIHFAIGSHDEAIAYLAHPLLGARLRDATQAMLAIDNKSALEILGSPDDLKFQSSMTLFNTVEPNDIFAIALEKYFSGERDTRTLSTLREINK